MTIDSYSKTISEIAVNNDIRVINALGRHLSDLYSIPFRNYHNLDHVQACLTELEHVANTLPWKRLCELKIALWYHDVIYEPGANNNEKRSALWATDDLTLLEVSAESMHNILKDIMVTTHTMDPESIEQRYMVDVDLAILGQPWEIYRGYALGIRGEHKSVNDYHYATRRSVILEEFLDKPFIYRSEFFRNKYEDSARKNIVREIDILKHMKEDAQAAMNRG